MSELKRGRVRALLVAVAPGPTLAPQLGGVYFLDDEENTLGLLH